MQVYVQVIVFACKIYGGLRARVHSSIQMTVVVYSRLQQKLVFPGEQSPFPPRAPLTFPILK